MVDLQADCLVIGGGSAGLTAATYLGRFRRKVLLVDSGESRASWIPVTQNFIGFCGGISGPDLLRRMQQQADQCGARRLAAEIEVLKWRDDGSFVGSWQGARVTAKQCFSQPEVSVLNRRSKMRAAQSKTGSSDIALSVTG